MTTGQSLALETRIPENAGACPVEQALNLEDHSVPDTSKVKGTERVAAKHISAQMILLLTRQSSK